jgi:hypothetical protein
LECDGAAHVYTVRGTRAQGGAATRSLTLTTKPPS